MSTSVFVIVRYESIWHRVKGNESKWQHLTVYFLTFVDAPRITLAPKDQKVADNGMVSFFCKASGNPAPDIHWRKNGKRVAINRQRYMGIEMPHGSVLRIEPVRARRDDALFECVADNGIGEPATASATLEIYPEGEGTY